jgi:anti-sigma-K factor RskA
MNHTEWLERAELHALDALDGEERTRFEAHLAAGCDRCEDHIRVTREALALLPRSLPPVTPPPGVKARLLATIAAGRAPAAKPRAVIPWWMLGVSAAAAAVILILGLNLWVARQELRGLRDSVASLQGGVAQQEEALRLLADPQVRPVLLAGLPPSPGAVGRLLWNPVTRTGVLLTSGLPQTPAGKAYELWAIAGAAPVPAGVFTVDQNGRATFRLPPLSLTGAVEKFAVTLEPAGGVPSPTGPMHLLGNV